MKQIHILLGVLISISAYTQDASVSGRLSDETTIDRKAVLKSTLTFSGTVHETLFWSLYDQYEREIPEMITCTLVDLLVEGQHSAGARENIESKLSNQMAEIATKRKFFEKINAAANGTIAMRFLQSEVLTDLMLKSRYFESSSLQHSVWTSRLMNNESERLSQIGATLRIREESLTKLEPLFLDYEFEYSRVVGHALVWFEQYVEDVSDLTPAQCSSMGIEFLNMQLNEIKLKQRFFNRIADELGEDLAMRFLSLEDYFFTMDKLNVWSQNDYAAR